MGAVSAMVSVVPANVSDRCKDFRWSCGEFRGGVKALSWFRNLKWELMF